MAHKGSGLIKAAFDTDNFLMRFSEKVLDIAADINRIEDADAGFVDPFYLSARPYAEMDNGSQPKHHGVNGDNNQQDNK